MLDEVKVPRDIGERKRSFGAICAQMRSFYQDRLGTNIGKALENEHYRFLLRCAHDELLNDVLRKQWSFDGFVVSDYDAWCENRTPFFPAPFLDWKNDQFAKTGSGQI